MKIMITGIGGVGGYIASVLCANYDDVTLIARRKRKESLQTKGLVVHSDFFGDHTAHPAVTDDPASAGIQDVIFVCVKNYSLEAALTAVLPCIGDDRASLVVAGCAILESILDIWPAPTLGVADRGIREGILRSLIAADAQGERSRAEILAARGDAK